MVDARSFYQLSPTAVVGAPMAGGPSTPALTTAVSVAGGLGVHAATYVPLDRLAKELTEIAAAVDRYGLNFFVPGSPAEFEDREQAVAAYRQTLEPLAARADVTLPQPTWNDDDYPAKVALAVERRIPYASFTFGIPTPETLEAFRAVGTHIAITVSSVDDAKVAAAVADSLVVQGAEAGGHRSTFAVSATPNDQSTAELVAAVAAEVAVPLVAAGGVMTAADVALLKAAGAAGVQVGTALLRTPEAGTKAAHRAALAAGDRDTVVTRSYSGRPARGLVNSFIQEFDSLAPPAFPELNTLTGVIRRALVDDPDVINLWAGTGYRAAQDKPAAEIIADLIS